MTCSLCNKPDVELQNSHIIPKFIFRFIKKTGGSDFLRFAENPNKRVQDGFKRYLLCLDCEQLLNTWETDFSKQLFYPYYDNKEIILNYNDWLIKFCVSISWRNLILSKLDNNLEHLTPKQLVTANLALKVWGDYLLGKKPNPGSFEQHLLLLDSVEEHTFKPEDVPPTLNRYLNRAVDLDIMASPNQVFIYTKLPLFLIIGIIDMKSSKKWVNTKVKLSGKISSKVDRKISGLIGDRINAGGKKMAKILQSYSPNQQKLIDNTIENNIERVANSESFKSMQDDYKLFGKHVFFSKKEDL
ncbi:MAG: hypothetical protein JJU13_08410 [Balneolaceae bacterium]|nr:hypothetical protein [Balneolaceae bacterium]